MIAVRGILRRLVLVTGTVVMSLFVPPALAQEGNGEPDVVEAMVIGPVVIEQGALTDEQFDNWVDQIVSDLNGTDAPERGQLYLRLTLELEWIQASCGITEAQKKKLQIAGRGDIKRFFDEMQEIKRQYRENKADPFQITKMQNRLAIIQASSAEELFGESSFLSKMVRSTLSAGQAAAYEKAKEEAKTFARRAAVLQAVQYLDLAIGLTELQRQKLSELFLRDLKRTKQPERAELPLQFMMILRTSKLPRAELEAIFDPEQLKVMKALLEQLSDGANAARIGAMPARAFDDLVIEPGVEPGGVPEVKVPFPEPAGK